MYSTTGVTRRQFGQICRFVRESVTEDTWPPILGLSASVRVTLTYLRRNRTQADLAETFGVSQPTISRAVTAMTGPIGAVLAGWVPTADDLADDVPYVVDGSLLPCWSWASHPDLYSGKHHTTGVNVQVACTLSGAPVWVSDPLPGSTHDLTALRAHGLLDHPTTPATLIADKGYQGSGMITPLKKPIGGTLTDDRKNYNTQVNRVRAVIERVIAHLKNWRILHTDYRRPFPTFQQTITTVIALHFYTLTA
jgi:hypothetical protein